MLTAKIKTALISVYNKDKLEPIVKLLDQHKVRIYSTGGTQKFIESLGINVIPVEDITSYPSILGGRVKTLHPKIFGGILYRREQKKDCDQISQYQIPAIDLVIVDLYPFEETVASPLPPQSWPDVHRTSSSPKGGKKTSSKASDEEIIEKIDIGGISLIRAAAKNFRDVVIVPTREEYGRIEAILREKNCTTGIEDRKLLAAIAFDITSHYDTMIFNYFNTTNNSPPKSPQRGDFANPYCSVFKQSVRESQKLRYGENPHQTGVFYGDLDEMFEQLNGKALSYNNLVDIDAAINLISEFNPDSAGATFAVLKHTNACGVASAKLMEDAYTKALAADPVSAFGGVLICNSKLDVATAEELHKLFFEVILAPDYDQQALSLLKEKKNRIILKVQSSKFKVQSSHPSGDHPKGGKFKEFKSILNGIIEQDIDFKSETTKDFTCVTKKKPTEEENNALIFANKVAKHSKSNTIVFAKAGQLLASGIGQTSRVDALNQAIDKAKRFGLSIEDSVMASEAFFPFADCVEIANKAGIKAVIQPGGSIKDKDSIAYCDANDMAMVFTGIRHFKH
ncbi:MAG: bifunctional phosphoribosylaminoimidazolecarboxamide formyltransferase/IMP cyclohydrolase [Bacteroidetes bacterium]|nr:bifunctional phosphoribosylaminoimidazolecarboxamide formyltransferase/IMP cyclohydrolase [Bacteroidota bacterium]